MSSDTPIVSKPIGFPVVLERNVFFFCQTMPWQIATIMRQQLHKKVAFATATPIRFHCVPLKRHSCSRKCTFTAEAESPPVALKRPDAGLIGRRGVTGTLLANLWPVPILGDYSWFLNVYDREIAASVGPFVVDAEDGSLILEFCPGQKPEEGNDGKSFRAFPGIATGNINIRKAVEDMDDGGRYQLRMFEKGGSENFFTRRNEVHLDASVESARDLTDVWRDPAPTYKVISRASSYEIREIYAGCGSSPRSTSPLEYFAMNLFPIFPFMKYSCFVCVWRQRQTTSPVALDKLDHQLRLSFFDPLEIPNVEEQGDDTLPAIAQFAVKVFYGAVTDGLAAIQHKSLLEAISSSPSTRAVSENNFRLVLDNSPNTVTPNRRNEIWVQVG